MCRPTSRPHPSRQSNSSTGAEPGCAESCYPGRNRTVAVAATHCTLWPRWAGAGPGGAHQRPAAPHALFCACLQDARRRALAPSTFRHLLGLARGCCGACRRACKRIRCCCRSSACRCAHRCWLRRAPIASSGWPCREAWRAPGVCCRTTTMAAATAGCSPALAGTLTRCLPGPSCMWMAHGVCGTRGGSGGLPCRQTLAARENTLLRRCLCSLPIVWARPTAHLHTPGIDRGIAAAHPATKPNAHFSCASSSGSPAILSRPPRCSSHTCCLEVRWKEP